MAVHPAAEILRPDLQLRDFRLEAAPGLKAGSQSFRAI
jgi:hypothetical protein